MQLLAYKPTNMASHMCSLQADANPSKASHLLISIHRCEGLTRILPVQDSDMHHATELVQRPYVHYCPPGRNIGHDTLVGDGMAPEFHDAASWPIVRSAALREALCQSQLQVSTVRAHLVFYGCILPLEPCFNQPQQCCMPQADWCSPCPVLGYDSQVFDTILLSSRSDVKQRCLPIR